MTIQLLVGERQSKESNKAVIACNDYLRMGAGRSLRSLIQRYNDCTTEKPPVKNFRTVARWSSEHNWVDRAEAYDAMMEEKKNKEREKIMNEKLALDYKRVLEIHELYELLKEQLMEKGQDDVLHNLWVPDVKNVGGSPVDIEKYNSALISDLRGLLDDLAKETGGRKQKIEQENSGITEIHVRYIDEKKDNGE